MDTTGDYATGDTAVSALLAKPESNGTSAAARFLQAADRRPRRVVTVDMPLGPETDETEAIDIEVRAMLAGERADFYKQNAEDVDLVIFGCYTPGTDKKMFNVDEHPEYRDALLRMPAGVIAQLAVEVISISGLDQTARRVAGKGSTSSRS